MKALLRIRIVCVFLVACLVIFIIKLVYQNNQSYSSDNEDDGSSLPMGNDYSAVVKSILTKVPINCGKNKLCIGVGTSFFGKYSNWRAYVDAWTNQKACPLRCQIIANTSQAHLVIFMGKDLMDFNKFVDNILWKKRQSYQYYVYFNWESPYSTSQSGHNILQDSDYRLYFNWTATYDSLADAYIPYAKVTKHSSKVSTPLYDPNLKSKFMYAVISNCLPYNDRMVIVKELQMLGKLDVYGYCGRPFPKKETFQSLSQQYRFYLSFENAYCKDYITEKFFLNGLRSSAVPVTFGGTSRNDYVKVSPPQSFIYGPDFKNVTTLVNYLDSIAANETIYSSFLQWKHFYKISEVDKSEDMYCQLCEQLVRFSEHRVHKQADLFKFYNTKDLCM